MFEPTHETGGFRTVGPTEEGLREAYKGGRFPPLRPGDALDINSAYPAALVRSEADPHAEPDRDFTVNRRLTKNRRAKRPRHYVETMEFIGAVRRFLRAASRRVAEADEHELAALVALQSDLDSAISNAVRGQRAIGRSWAHIGMATGMTRQAAYKRWGKK